MLLQHFICTHHLKLIRRLSFQISRSFASVNVKEHIETPLPRLPNYSEYESFWYKYWTDKQLFTWRDCPNQESFTLLLPPPNITGNLHLGHALTIAIEDAIVRFNKMRGKNVLWVPGFDHAGIATHAILDRLSEKKTGKRLQELNQDEYSKLTSEWMRERMNDIRNQLKALGASVDFNREYFTLSDKMNQAVKDAFVRLHDLGLVERRRSMINYSFFLRSTLSDMEIQWRHFNGPTKVSVPGYDKPVEFGVLHNVAYPALDDNQQEIVVATTRPEGIAGDVAIAVHPDDDRYSHFVGRRVINPLSGRPIPVVADRRIDREFGTGAMKVTPGNSQLDFEIGQDHNFPIVDIFDSNGCLNCPDVKPEFSHIHGLNRFDAKEKTLQALMASGVYRGSSPHITRAPFCMRSGDLIEQILKDQWFIDTTSLNEELKEDLASGSIVVSPEHHVVSWQKVWASNSEWCISRQIRWGHPIPAYEIFNNGVSTNQFVVARSESEAREKISKSGNLENISLKADPDVLDTWFSSSLLPFSVFNVMHNSDSSPHYPLSLMETGFDILGFWVHRMMIIGKALTGRYPFKRILLHGMVCDARGKKMSKSRGNVIDPMEVVNGVSLEELLSKTEKLQEDGLLTPEEAKTAKEGQKSLLPRGIPPCGADALRLSLSVTDLKNHGINVDAGNIHHHRTMMNKMWQAVRFFEMNIPQVGGFKEMQLLSPENLSSMDSIMLSRLYSLVEKSNQAFLNYDLHFLSKTFHNFLYNDLCAFYIELLKPLLSSPSSQLIHSFTVFKYSMTTSLRCIHPLIPFITEELFQRIQHMSGVQCNTSILQQGYPTVDDYKRWKCDKSEEKRAIIEQIIHCLHLICDKLKVQATISGPGALELEDVKRYFTCRAPTIQNLTFGEKITQEANLIHVPIDNSEIIIEIEARNEHRATMIRQLETRLGKLRKDEMLSEKHGTHEEVRNGNRFNVTLTMFPYFHSTATEDCCGSEDGM